eukprot:gnl/Spiro4/10060_TR5335_c0_g1_i2.p1 gnl/Spiro4/10060_TR5335_c0_g1~~gnl/Spiro4/10060_TR5335_c0_g1_i2.p1  ORF type:complete len:305 (-),score=69.94 gnl/Spiro4/10060_TR5335_c0_g1_i2:35-949(-)
MQVSSGEREDALLDMVDSILERYRLCTAELDAAKSFAHTVVRGLDDARQALALSVAKTAAGPPTPSVQNPVGSSSATQSATPQLIDDDQHSVKSTASAPRGGVPDDALRNRRANVMSSYFNCPKPKPRPMARGTPARPGSQQRSGPRLFSAIADLGLAHCINGRDEMQDTYVVVDSYACSPSQAFFAVFDGHTGTHAANFAATCFHNLLAERLYNLSGSAGGGVGGASAGGGGSGSSSRNEKSKGPSSNSTGSTSSSSSHDNSNNNNTGAGTTGSSSASTINTSTATSTTTTATTAAATAPVPH